MPETDNPLTILPGYLLRRSANAMMGELRDRLSSVGLRVTDATVLILIGGENELTASQIGRALDIQRANMVPILSRLESDGLVMRKPLDRRSQAIVLSEKGKKRLAEAFSIIDRFEQELLERIPAEHRDHFIPALRALIE
ncbi:MarR family winged helix-turn-helix transcriptional regulator [Altererythrobacter sp.]|uniref:MarR family winged helix-turn-helix transcriptional regulator n=1 Tax=Altererythrobacter sp. TaxID=1872480 RepID=UPI003D07F6F8